MVVVEHDEDAIRQADYIIDIGVGAGVHGGRVVASGSAEQVANTTGSLTGEYLSGKRRIEVPTTRQLPKTIEIIKGKNHPRAIMDSFGGCNW